MVKATVKGKFVGQAAYDQIIWERDMAISQLAQADVSLGEKADIVRVDRVLEIIDKEIQLAKDCKISTVTLWRVRQDIFALRGEQK